MLHRIKRFVPSRALLAYHFALSLLATLIFRFPARKMIVIGVTGTNGKSSTVQLTGQLLMALGHSVGWTSTDSWRVKDRVTTNDKKMTMLGRFQTQKLLNEMVRAGCTHAVVETSSQGVAQFRHVGIAYDVMVLTNLAPTHIEAHGGFENYKAAKLKAFQTLAGKPGGVSVINVNDAFAAEFAAVGVERVVGFGRSDQRVFDVLTDERFLADEVEITKTGSRFSLQGVTFSTPLIGAFSLHNTLCAIAVAASLGARLEALQRPVSALTPIPGRLETFQKGGVTVVVDYAPEPHSLKALYEVVALFDPARIIHVTGSAGGGRDVAARAQVGTLAALHDDVVIVTNEDPYDDDPMEIIDDVADGAVAHGKRDGVDLFRILDRREAIGKAISLSKMGDMVLVTGKGSEPVMVVAGGRKIPSDDRVFVKEALSLMQDNV
ncbi:MAG: UDP-N-acetylmuramyl-tripeptide synthetase [Patescibacteria group bacterium]